MEENILAGDIGGTNSRFAHFVHVRQRGTQAPVERKEAKGEGALQLAEKIRLDTKAARSFAELLEMLRSSRFALKPERADIVVLAVAGPIQRGVYCAPPLIDWTIDLSQADKQFGFRRFSLLNDFVAQAFACRTSIADGAQVILPGESDPEGVVAVVGAGTGLGKAFLMADSRGRFVAGASEGGHASFAPESEREFRFAQMVVEKLGGRYASWNDIVSGRGLSFIHYFLTGEMLHPAEVARRFETSAETIEWMARFYGRVCRNFALEVLATGGVFVSGGVAAKNPVVVRHPEFARVFRESRAHNDLLAKIRVSLNSNEDSGLWGAGFHGAELL